MTPEMRLRRVVEQHDACVGAYMLTMRDLGDLRDLLDEVSRLRDEAADRGTPLLDTPNGCERCGHLGEHYCCASWGADA